MVSNLATARTWLAWIGPSSRCCVPHHVIGPCDVRSHLQPAAARRFRSGLLAAWLN